MHELAIRTRRCRAQSQQRQRPAEHTDGLSAMRLCGALDATLCDEPA